MPARSRAVDRPVTVAEPRGSTMPHGVALDAGRPGDVVVAGAVTGWSTALADAVVGAGGLQG